MLKQKLQEELRKSMLAKDTLKTSVLRMLLSAINYYEIKKGGARYEATDEDVLSVIQKEVKQRRDSIEQFQKGGRQDLVDKEKKELEMLQKYLPASLFTPLVPHHQKRSGVEDRRISTTCNTN
jgi:hypothetical protein